MRVAVIDLGSNTTRLLVADVEGGALQEVRRQSIVTRLAQAVDSRGMLEREAVERVLEVTERYSRIIEEEGAERAVVIATSSVRDARNSSDLKSELKGRAGLETTVISGEHEAELTYRGAIEGTGLAGDAETTLVTDVGGGSTEFVLGTGSKVTFTTSVPLGAVRQSERHLKADPPTEGELLSLSKEATDTTESAVPEPVRSSVKRSIAVAGTATSLAAIDQQLEKYDPERVHGYTLELSSCRDILARLASLPLAERKQVVGLHPDRAATIVAGTAILIASMEVFGRNSFEVSEHDLLHGAALEAAKNGQFSN